MATEFLKSLPANWKVVESVSHPGKFFYFNEKTRATTWKLPEKKSEKDPEKVRCRHILVKHSGVRNPKSKRTNEAVTYDRAQALKHVKELHAMLKKDSSIFEELAKKESDCSSFKRGGDLGFFKKKAMQKQFADPAFALQIGEMSGIVESNSGYHIILRVA